MTKILKHSTDVKYYGYKLKLRDEDEVLKENILYTFKHINSYFEILVNVVKVETELFKSYCTSLYVSHLWSTYRKSNFFNKLCCLQ